MLLLFFLQCCLWGWGLEIGIRDTLSRDGALLIYTGTWIWARIYTGPVLTGACSHVAHSRGREVGTCLVERRGFHCVLNQMKHQNPPQELRLCKYWDLTQFFQNNRVPNLQAGSSAWKGSFYKQCAHICFPSYQNFPTCQLPSPAAVSLLQARTPALALLSIRIYIPWLTQGCWTLCRETSKGFTALSC